ncbi:MAG TPA: hypothetical protein ENJ28_00960 [Gammaproteobacteria bacterium]|nr:hypothetical protein [Gammaproteobacteria bacterium]
MNDKIDMQKTSEGKESLKRASDSIALVRKFPLKNKGLVKPVENNWFGSLKNSQVLCKTQ